MPSLRAAAKALAFVQALDQDGTSRKGGTQDPPSTPRTSYRPFPRTSGNQQSGSSGTTYETCRFCSYCDSCDPHPYLRATTPQRWCRCDRGLLMEYVAVGAAHHACHSMSTTGGNQGHGYPPSILGGAQGAPPSPQMSGPYSGANSRPYSPPQPSTSSTFAQYSSLPQSHAGAGAAGQYATTQQSPLQQCSPPPIARPATWANGQTYGAGSPQSSYYQYTAPSQTRSSTDTSSQYYTPQQSPPPSGYGYLPQQTSQGHYVDGDRYVQEPDAVSSPPFDPANAPYSNMTSGGALCTGCDCPLQQ